MAQDFVGGMFGLTPEQTEAAQQANRMKLFSEMAQMSAPAQIRMGLLSAGGGLADLGAQAMGWKNKQVEAARANQEAMAGVNFQNPETMRMRANEIRATNPMIAARLDQMADTIETNMAERGKLRAETGLKEEQAKVAYQAHWDKIQKLQFALQQAKTSEEKNAIRAALQAEVNKGLSRGRMGAGEGFEQEYVEQVNLDTGAIERVPVGTPMMTKAEADRRTGGGGGGKGWKETDEAGNVTFFDAQGNILRVVPGAGKPSADFAKGRTDAIQRVASLESDIPTFGGKLDALIEHKGISGITGLQGGFPSAWGSNAAQADKALKEIKSWMSGIGLEKLRAGGGIGAVTEKEWSLLAEQVANLDSSAYSTEEFKKKLRDVKKEGERILAKAINELRIFNERSAPRVESVGTRQPAAKKFNPVTKRWE